jgi:hypothetical protein
LFYYLDLQEDFLPKLDEYLHFIIICLKDSRNFELCKTGLIILSFLIHSLPEHISNDNLIEIFPILFEILTNCENNRELKPLCISLFADICLLTPQVLLEENFVENLMTILFSACEITLSQKEDNDFILKLFQAITECWTCVNFGLKEITKIYNNATKKFELYISNIFVCLKLFIEKINSDNNSELNKKLLVIILSLICDLSSYESISKEMHVKFINQECIRNSLVEIRNIKDEKLKNEIDWVINTINDIIKKY